MYLGDYKINDRHGRSHGLEKGRGAAYCQKRYVKMICKKNICLETNLWEFPSFVPRASPPPPPTIAESCRRLVLTTLSWARVLLKIGPENKNFIIRVYRGASTFTKKIPWTLCCSTRPPPLAIISAVHFSTRQWLRFKYKINSEAKPFDMIVVQVDDFFSTPISVVAETWKFETNAFVDGVVLQKKRPPLVIELRSPNFSDLLVLIRPSRGQFHWVDHNKFMHLAKLILSIYQNSCKIYCLWQVLS